MTTSYPSLVGLTYFESGIEAVSLCEGESTALVQLKNSGKEFIRLPAQALELQDLVSGATEEIHHSGGAALNSLWATNIPQITLRPGEALASDMARYSGHNLASVRIAHGVQLDLQSKNDESSGNETSVQLSALPKWLDTDSAPAALHMPTQSNGTVQIVLHKGPELSYPVSSTQQCLLPVVVERSTAAIQARNMTTQRLLR